ncbi:MAG: hypothetical protein IBX44_02540 [Sulfurospirillum sp.]|nr:hypothetical protein [Sulfurospirillum sp.]
MKVKSLKIATIEGKFVKMGQEIELADKVAKKYIDAGFVEPVQEPETETKTTKPTKAK